MGPRARFRRIDLGYPEGAEEFASWIEPAGRIDYLVNDIAFDDRVPFERVDADVCDRFWRVNLRSYILVARACLDLLRAGRGKSIVNLGTTNGLLGLEPFVAYNAAKSGIVGFTRSLARELGREGIRVNTVSPGWIMTEKQLRLHVTEEDRAGLLRDQALKFLLEPRHVAPVVLFLLGSASAGITGQEIVVDGGKYMG
jgi:NAD(P)-dependent dehydrogenase (short-subunit alcohol dehydrogenase family)